MNPDLYGRHNRTQLSLDYGHFKLDHLVIWEEPTGKFIRFIGSGIERDL